MEVMRNDMRAFPVLALNFLFCFYSAGWDLECGDLTLIVCMDLVWGGGLGGYG